MKKFLVVLCMLICMFSITACGKNAAVEQPDFLTVNGLSGETSEETVQDMAVYYYLFAVDSIMNELVDGYVFQYEDMAWLTKTEMSYETALEEMENIQTFDFESQEAYKEFLKTIKVELDEDEAIALIPLDGEKRDAEIEVIFDKKGNVTSMTINVEYTFGELMKNAALNTLLGMGTVFVILILICFIISSFRLISKFEEGMKNKSSNKDIKDEAVNNTIAQIEEREELSDDTELVAVIAAAIATYEGTSTDGFVVRSIRKANRNKWLNA